MSPRTDAPQRPLPAATGRPWCPHQEAGPCRFSSDRHLEHELCPSTSTRERARLPHSPKKLLSIYRASLWTVRDSGHDIPSERASTHEQNGPISVHADFFLSEHLIHHVCEEALARVWAANSQLSSELVPTASIQHGNSGPLKLSTHNETMRHSEN